MWPYQHLHENVESPPQNSAEEDAAVSNFSISPPPSPLVDFHERETPPPTPTNTLRPPRRFTICGIETTDEIESQCALRRSPFNRGVNVRIPLSSRSRSPLLVRPAVWRRGAAVHQRGIRRPQYRRYDWLEDTMSDSDDDLVPPMSLSPPSGCTSVDLLLLKSLDSYVLSMHTQEELAAAVRRPPSTARIWPRRRLIRPNPLTYGHRSSESENEDDSQVDTDDDGASSEEIETEPLRITRSDSNSFMFKYKTSLHKGNSEPPEIARPRRRLCAIQSMPQPSLLAKQVANRVIKHARYARNMYEEDMCCLTCGLIPICPVTGQCGHTRCTKCIEIMTNCPCGNESPEPLSINILIRDLLVKTAGDRTNRNWKGVSTATKKRAVPANNLLTGARAACSGPIRPKRNTRHFFAPSGPYQQYNPMSARARFAYAMELLQSGRHMDAAPQFALAAASSDSDLRLARSLLAQVIMVLSENRDPRVLTRELNHFVSQLTSISWIKSADMECILCCDVFTAPVTTPCGHMFCRTCIEKTLDYRKRCPLCLRGLSDFNLTETKDTSFVKGALAAVNALHIPKPMEEDDLVPIFVCTVAYPSVPCPLFIFDPRYWLMIRRVLESGSRRFGMVALDRDRKYADFGTVLEVRDCVHLEDGRSILSTIGLTRFKVIERCFRDGCEVARIQPIKDIPPDQGVATADLKIYASQILLKAIFWLSQLSSSVISDIENAFGCLPTTPDDDNNDDWWDSADGPSWLWWLVAVLPLRTEIKVLILSTNCLIKRMMAIARTLEAVARVSLTVSSPGQCLRQPLPTPPTTTSSSVVN